MGIIETANESFKPLISILPGCIFAKDPTALTKFGWTVVPMMITLHRTLDGDKANVNVNNLTRRSPVMVGAEQELDRCGKNTGQKEADSEKAQRIRLDKPILFLDMNLFLA